jgi:hypothetical protein
MAQALQTFRVFLNDGSHVDVPGDTFGRDGTDWVIYRGTDWPNGDEEARFPAYNVNGIALRS